MKQRKHNYNHAHSKGLALVELMIAMTLGLVLIGAATGIMLSNSKSFRATQDISKTQDTTRLAFELMARDIRQAGSVPCGNSVAVKNKLTNNSGTLPWYFDWHGNIQQSEDADDTKTKQLIGYSDHDSAKWADREHKCGSECEFLTNRVTGTDILTLFYATNEGSSLKYSQSSGKPYILNQPNNNFHNDDFLFICDNQAANIFRAAVSKSDTGDMSVEKTQLNNLTTPTDSFSKNAVIGKLKSRAWYIGTNEQGDKSLYLAELTSAGLKPIEIAQQVDDLKLSYRIANSAEFKTADRIESLKLWQQVNAVQITLTVPIQNENDITLREFTSIVALRNHTQ